MSDPYRKRGEPAPVPKELRRWFTKSSDVEKGPFEASAVRRSFKDGYIKAATLVRAEDESEWRELASVSELRVPGMSLPLPAAKLSPLSVSPMMPQAPALQRGSFWGGFVATAFFGLLALVIVYATSKEAETRRGARNGFFVRIGFMALFVIFTIATTRK